MHSEEWKVMAILAALWVPGMGMIVVIYGTVRKNRWGINLDRVACPRCGTTAPVARQPASRRQALWGGWTCEVCGVEVDKWGREIRAVGPRPAAAYRSEAEARAVVKKRLLVAAVICFPLTYLVDWLLGEGVQTNLMDAFFQFCGNLARISHQ